MVLGTLTFYVSRINGIWFTITNRRFRHKNTDGG